MTYLKVGLGIAFAALAGITALGQAPAPTQATDRNLVITLMGEHGHPPPSLTPAQIEVQAGRDTAEVLAWQPYPADARIDLCIVIDDDAARLTTQLDDLKTFMQALPPNVALAVVYMNTSTVELTQPFTLDHALAVRAVRRPSATSGVSPSPFSSLDALFSKWPVHPDRRREMVLITDAQEHLTGNDINNETILHTMAEAVNLDVVTFGIHASGATEDAAETTELKTPMGRMGGRGMGDLGNIGTPKSNAEAAIGSLTALSEATGGHAYAQGDTTPSRFTPYLDDIKVRLASQVRLTIPAHLPNEKGLVSLKVQLKNANGAELTAPKQLYAH